MVLGFCLGPGSAGVPACVGGLGGSPHCALDIFKMTSSYYAGKIVASPIKLIMNVDFKA